MKHKISIDKGAGSWAIFDDRFQIVKPFEKYTDETAALEEAKAWVKERTEVEPEIIYPNITSFRKSSRK